MEDVAFLALEEDGPLEYGLRLARAPHITQGTQVLVVGYPLYSDSSPAFVNTLFENIYGVKRGSPGELLAVEADLLYHDCTTLPGSSGSPVFELRTGLVVGIHASGQFAFRNTAVSTRAIQIQPQLRALVAAWEP